MRKTRLVDCNPRWGTDYGDCVEHYITFDCPEGHAECLHTIPFTPDLAGAPRTAAHAQWTRVGGDFATLTLSPSIRRIPRHASREAAIEAGCIPEYVTESMLCALHVTIDLGQINFCEDSH